MCGGGKVGARGRGSLISQIGRQELNERSRGSLLNVEITGWINGLPPPPQKSAWAIYEACLARVSYMVQ